MRAGVTQLSPAQNLLPGLAFALPGAWQGLRTASPESRAGGRLGGAGLAPLTLRDPRSSPCARVRGSGSVPYSTQGPAWSEGAPDLGFSPVPGLRKEHGRHAGHRPSAGSPAQPGLRRHPVLGSLRTRQKLPLQARPCAPCAPEEARIRCHQESASQQGNGPKPVSCGGRRAAPRLLGLRRILPGAVPAVFHVCVTVA